MRSRSASIAFVCVVAGVVIPATGRVAAAQASIRNPAAAQALYDDARQLVAAGKFADACPKFKESYRLDPGGGTLLNLADCYEKQGKTALAWSTFKEALVVAQRDGRADRAEFATKHIAALEGRLARLTVHVPAGARVPGLTIALDGAPLGDAAWEVAMPVDPGTHVVEAGAPGKRSVDLSVDVPASAVRQSIEVPALADAVVADSSAAGPGAVAAVEPKAGATAEAATESAPAPSHARATAGWIVGGVGIASIAVGSYFGLHSFSLWSERNGDCAHGCNETAKNAGDDARQAATIADVTLGVGVAAVAVATYLIISGYGHSGAAPRSAALHVAPSALPGGAGLWIGGDL
jgi:hypothetical protein